LQSGWLDIALVLGVFVGPPATIFGYLILREVRRLRLAASDLKTELRTTSAEGFPPPDPPTTDSQSDV
jgi:hypothetical protein